LLSPDPLGTGSTAGFRSEDSKNLEELRGLLLTLPPCGIQTQGAEAAGLMVGEAGAVTTSTSPNPPGSAQLMLFHEGAAPAVTQGASRASSRLQVGSLAIRSTKPDTKLSLPAVI